MKVERAVTISTPDMMAFRGGGRIGWDRVERQAAEMAEEASLLTYRAHRILDIEVWAEPLSQSYLYKIYVGEA